MLILKIFDGQHVYVFFFVSLSTSYFALGMYSYGIFVSKIIHFSPPIESSMIRNPASSLRFLTCYTIPPPTKKLDNVLPIVQ